MNAHENARTTPRSREELVRRVLGEIQPVKVVADAFGISPRTARKWVARFTSRPAARTSTPSSRPLASLKALLRKAAVRTRDKLRHAVATALDAFSPEERANFFTAAGYEPE